MLAQYVLYAVEDIKGVDFGLFDFDMEANMYFFVLSPDEQILLRYSGRDSRGPVSYYSTRSHENALVRGLDRFRQYREGAIPREPRPAPEFQDDYREYENVRDRLSKGACVRCHHIAEARISFKQAEGTLEKLEDLWHYPDGRRLGFAFEVDTGTVLLEATGPALEAGLRPGDELIAVDGREVSTYADIQYRLHRVGGDADRLHLIVDRDGERLALEVGLPPFWKASDALADQHRFLALKPFPGFWGKALDARERAELGLPAEGMATRVGRFWAETSAYRAGLREGDIIVAIDDEDSSPATRDARVFLRLFREAGDRVRLTFLRGEVRHTIESILTEER